MNNALKNFIKAAAEESACMQIDSQTELFETLSSLLKRYSGDDLLMAYAALTAHMAPAVALLASNILPDLMNDPSHPIHAAIRSIKPKTH
jgi:hypothetical protein